MTLTVGILGLAGSGKDTFASMLQEELSKLGQDFKIDRYARPIKELTADIFCLSVDAIEIREIKEQPRYVTTDKLLRKCHVMLQDTLGFNTEEYTTAMTVVQESWVNVGHFTWLSPREFLQVFGTDVVRAVRPNAWVDILQERDENLIVPDVRFENELCDVNHLVTRFDRTPRPEHPSEQFAWDLQWEHNCWMPQVPHVCNGMRYSTLGTLREHAAYVASLVIKQL